MKRKSLLLIIPFAAAALVGCTPSTVPCEQAQISFSEGSVNLTVGSEKELNYSIEGGACSGELKFEVADTSIAEVIQKDGKYYVKGKKAGDTTITCNGKTIKVYVSNGEDPEPTKEVSKVTGLDKVTAPQIKVGDEFKAEWVSLKVEYTDGETGTVVADRVEISTEVAGEAISGTAYYKEFEGVTFTIKVVEEYTADYGTEDNPVSVSQALITMGVDCKSDNQLTKQPIYCTGTVKEIKNRFDYDGNEDGIIDCYELYVTDGTNDVYVYRMHASAELTDTVVEGAQIKWVGYGKNFKGTLEFVDNGANKCTLLDNGTPTPPQKEVTGITDASYSKTLYVGGTINPQDVTLTVTYSDTTSGSVKAQSVDGYSTEQAGTTTATAHYGNFTKTFDVEVVAQGQAVYGTEDNPVSVSQAVATMNIDCANDGDLTKQAIYCTGTVKEIKNRFDYDGNKDGIIDCYELYVTDGTTDVYVYRMHASAELTDTVVEGAQIKWVGYGKNYQGKLEFVDNGANKCTLLDNGTPTPEKEVTGITAASYTKTLYVGGTINPADVTLTVTYSDTTSGSVKAESVDGYSTEEAGNTTATAHYGTFTKDFVVEVKAKPAPSGNSYNLIKSNDDVTEGQYLIVYGSKSFNGVDTTANYATVDVSDESIEASDELVYVEFEEMSGGYAIKVVGGDNDEKYIYGQSGQNKLLFDTNKKLNTISVDNDGKATIVSETSILKFNTNTGTSDDRFRYYKSANTDEKMALPSLYKLGTPTPQKQITGVELQGTLAKSSYVEGQTFDPSGLSLKVTYNEGDPDVLTSGFTFNVTNPLAVGEYDLKATYQGHTTEDSVHISVVALAITALEIKSGMTKTAYVLEEAWAPAGIVVEATYNDGSKANLQSDDYTLEFDPTEPALDTEEVSIVAKVANGITSAAYTQKVSVTEEKVEATLTGIEASEYTKTATVGQTYTFDGIVTATYSDGSSHEVTGYTWTTAISTASAGEKTGVISYTEGDETKTCDVVVTVSEPAPVESSIKAAYEAGEPLAHNAETTESYTFSGVVVAMRHGSGSDYEYYVQDGEYGMLVFGKGAAISGFAVGKKVQVTSTIKKYSGTIETGTISSSSVIGDAAVPSSTAITSSSVLENTKQNVRANITGVVSAKTTFSASADETFSLTVGNDTIKVYIKKTLFNQFGTTVSSIQVGDTITVTDGVRGIYTNSSNATTHQVLVCDTSSLSKYVPEVTNVSISGDFTKKTYNLGNDWDISGLAFKGTTTDGEITLNSSDFDFEFNPAKASDTKINSVEVTATYKTKPELTCSKTITGITVTDTPAVEPYDVTFKAGKNTDYSKTEEQTLDNITWVLNANLQSGVKLGGKGSIGDRFVSTKTLFENEVSKFTLFIGTIDAEITINSITLYAYKSLDDMAAGTSKAVSTVSGSVVDSAVSFNKPLGDSWDEVYFKIVFNLSNSKTDKNKGVTLTGAKVEF